MNIFLHFWSFVVCYSFRNYICSFCWLLRFKLYYNKDKSKQLSCLPDGFMDHEFWIQNPELLCLIQNLLTKKILINKWTILFVVQKFVKPCTSNDWINNFLYLADPIPTVCWEQFINCTILGPGTGKACPPIVDVCI